MVKNSRLWLVLPFLLLPQLAQAGFQGGIQAKTTQHENFNLANGETEPKKETVNSVTVSMTWFMASSKDFVWLVNAYYGYSDYDKYDHLSGSTASLLGGMFYRINSTNSMTVKLGKRERNYDDEDLSLYQDDAHFIIAQLTHRLSPTTLLNEKIKFEENEPKIDKNKYTSTTGQLWFEWKVARKTKLSMGYVHTEREYDNRGDTYTFEEPYISLSYSLTRNMYTRVGYSKLKMTEDNGERAYNASAYLAVGFGF